MNKTRVLNLNKINIKEFVRTKKVVVCFCFLLALTFLGIVIAFVFNYIHKNIDLSQYEAINNFLSVLNTTIPHNIKDYSSLYCSQIVTMYSLLCFLVFSKIIPDEISKGKWIFPINYGYKQSEIIISKAFVYALFSCLPITPLFFAYHFSLQLMFEGENYKFLELLGRCMLLFFDEFCIISLAIVLSSKKQYIVFLISLFSYFAIMPDMLSFLPFKQYLPTFVYTYLYLNGSIDWKLSIPIFENIAVYSLILTLCLVHSTKINVNER